MTGSVQPATRAALFSKLQTALAVDSTFASRGQASYGWTSTLENKRERVWVRGGRSVMQVAALRPGATVLNETGGEFYVFTEVVLPGVDQQTVTARTYDLAAIVIGQVALHKTDLGVPGLKWIVPGTVELDAEGAVDRGSAARVRVTVNYEARVEQ